MCLIFSSYVLLQSHGELHSPLGPQGLTMVNCSPWKLQRRSFSKLNGSPGVRLFEFHLECSIGVWMDGWKHVKRQSDRDRWIAGSQKKRAIVSMAETEEEHRAMRMAEFNNKKAMQARWHADSPSARFDWTDSIYLSIYLSILFIVGFDSGDFSLGFPKRNCDPPSFSICFTNLGPRLKDWDT